MSKSQLIEDLRQLVPPQHIRLDEPMRYHTSFRIGGPADIMVLPASTCQVVSVIRLARQRGVPVFVIGNGTNVLVRDGGLRGVVVKLADNFQAVQVRGHKIWAEAGALLVKVARAAWQAGLTGLEFASGIPGSLGGAITMNAGAYGGEMKDVLASIVCCNQEGEICRLQRDELELEYRSSRVQKECYTVLEAILSLRPGDREAIKARMDEFNRRRREKQPLQLPSAGSVFKRPPGYYAGKLIQDAGLRGARIGDAQVSEMHCGFIVNRGQATAADVLQLIEHIQTTVRQKFGVELEPEIRIIGED